MKPVCSLQEAQKLSICRFCADPYDKQPLKDKFILDYGREFAHDSCLRKYERHLKRQIPDRDTYGHG